MYELKKVVNNTYYIESPSKIGLYKLNESEVCLIDTGNDKESGRKIYKILQENNWNLKFIINTHSNADHIGGNNYLQEKTNCLIYNNKAENSFTNYPILESSFLYGGYPPKELQNKFLKAKSSNSLEISELKLPVGFKVIDLPGHFFNMIGIQTPDNVIFLGDSLFSEDIINKYHIFFIYDVLEYLNTLEKIENLDADYFIPSHNQVVTCTKDIVNLNKNKILEIINKILKICEKPRIMEEIIQNVFEEYKLTMNFNQYVLVGSTTKSYLSYLLDQNKVKIIFENNKMLWISNIL